MKAHPVSSSETPPAARPGERRYAGMTADERRAERRRRLLDTALELFGTDGYAYTGIERLCSRAGVTARHFYEEFGSREGLLIALFDDIVRDTLDAVAAAVAAAPRDDAWEMTRAGMLAFVHGMVDDPRRARVQCLEVVGVSPALEARRREVLHLYADLVSEQSRALGLGASSSDRQREAASIALVGGTNELLIEWLTAEGAYQATVDELIDDLVRIYVAVGRDDGDPAPRA
jgi:AcrR family transcriptional regulator